jgi:hypothetical protein
VSATTRSDAPLSPRLLDAGEKLERSALAGVRAHPALTRVLAELGPEHLDAEVHRRLRDAILGDESAADELMPLLAELDALADADGIDEETAKQLLLRLRERKLRRELESADDAEVRGLQHRLAEIRTAIREFA